MHLSPRVRMNSCSVLYFCTVFLILYGALRCAKYIGKIKISNNYAFTYLHFVFLWILILNHSIQRFIQKRIFILFLFFFFKFIFIKEV